MKLITIIIVLAFSVSITSQKAMAENVGFKEHVEESPKELAAYMADLQVLTHKLGLSIEAKNPPLIRFYWHESLVLIEEIQETLPEYEGTPVALYMDRMAHPAYKLIREKYDAPQDSPEYFEHLDTAYDSLIATCNACHVSSSHPYLRIKRNSHNPYLQDFSARESTK